MSNAVVPVFAQGRLFE